MAWTNTARQSAPAASKASGFAVAAFAVAAFAALMRLISQEDAELRPSHVLWRRDQSAARDPAPVKRGQPHQARRAQARPCPTAARPPKHRGQRRFARVAAEGSALA